MQESPIAAGWTVEDDAEGPLTFRRGAEPPMYLDEAMAAGMLRDVRKAWGQTQHQAAEEIGVTETAFGRWERGIARPIPLCEEALLDYLIGEE